MFLVASKKALSLQTQEWIDKSRQHHQVELEHWSENLVDPEEEVANKLDKQISYLMESAEEFLSLSRKVWGTQQVWDDEDLQISLNDMSKDIAYAYLYVDEASDWICEIKK